MGWGQGWGGSTIDRAALLGGLPEGPGATGTEAGLRVRTVRMLAAAANLPLSLCQLLPRMASTPWLPPPTHPHHPPPTSPLPVNTSMQERSTKTRRCRGSEECMDSGPPTRRISCAEGGGGRVAGAFCVCAVSSPAASAAERCSSTPLTLLHAACYACATHPVTALLCTGRSQGPLRKAGATSPQQPLPKAAPP